MTIVIPEIYHNSPGPLPASPMPSRHSNFSELCLGFFKRRHPIRARHWTVDGKRPEPAQTVGTAAATSSLSPLTQARFPSPSAGVPGTAATLDRTR